MDMDYWTKTSTGQSDTKQDWNLIQNPGTYEHIDRLQEHDMFSSHTSTNWNGDKPKIRN